MGSRSGRRTARASPQAPRRTPRQAKRQRASAAALTLPAAGLGDGVVRLRLPRETDAHAIAEGCSDPEVARWTRIPSPYTLEDARAWIAMTQLQLKRGKELQLVVVREEEDRPIGGAALRLRDGRAPNGEIGYWMAADARRRGIGSRAVRLLASHGLEALALRWIEIAVSPHNEASRRLALRAGFEPLGVELREFKGRTEEFELFRRERVDPR